MKIQINRNHIFLLAFTVLNTGILSAQTTDFTKASLIISDNIKSPVKEILLRVLQEEVYQRTSIELQPASEWTKNPVIALATINDAAINGKTIPRRTGDNLPETKAEGFMMMLTKLSGARWDGIPQGMSGTL